MDQQNNQSQLTERIQAKPESAVATNATIPVKQKEEKETNMADVNQADLWSLSKEHSDIRREGVEHTNEIVKEGLKGDYNSLNAIKDSRFEVVSRVESNADRLERAVETTKDTMTDRFFVVGRDTQDLRAQVIAQQQQMVAGFASIAKDTEIASLKTQIDAAKNTAALAEKIAADGEKTRGLINDLKYQDLNRYLIERNALIAEERFGRRHWRGAYDQAQFAAVSSQMQNFGSQLQETRQGMVNFGTMAGVGQTSSSNNV